MELGLRSEVRNLNPCQGHSRKRDEGDVRQGNTTANNESKEFVPFSVRSSEPAARAAGRLRPWCTRRSIGQKRVECDIMDHTGRLDA
jgi:hypothetical protein